LVWRQEGHPAWPDALPVAKPTGPVKKLDVGLLVVLIWLQLCATYSL